MTAGFDIPDDARPRHGPIPRRRLDGWLLAPLAVALLVSVPAFSVLWLAINPTDDIWTHLAATVLPGYLATTALLMAGVGVGTLAIGVPTAWLVTMCRFPGRGLFQWALLVPLAMPGYIVAYVYTDLLDFAGPVQGSLRAVFGWSSSRDYWFPEIRGIGGAVAMLTLTLYPYVYLLARAAFLEQAVGLFEASRTLGHGAWASFRRVALPMARPAIVIGVVLALMETLNDYGTVDFFAVNSFTIGIVNVWTNMNSTTGAAQMAALLLAIVVALIWLERSARRRRRFHGATVRRQELPSYRLAGGAGLAALAACAAPIAFGFVLPAVILANYALDNYATTFGLNYLDYLWHSLELSVLAAGLAVVLAIFLGYALRLRGGAVLRAVTGVAGIGYAIPGAVLAVGLIVPLAAFDNRLDGLMREWFGISTGLILSGTIFAVTFGFVVRVLALALGAVEAWLGRIPRNLDDAARTLGAAPGAVLRRVHVPLMRGSVLTGAMLVFVDAMKELPMTVLLRPFNFETLATFVHQYASDEMLADSALAALTIVAAGILPVIVLSRAIGRSRPTGPDRR